MNLNQNQKNILYTFIPISLMFGFGFGLMFGNLGVFFVCSAIPLTITGIAVHNLAD